MRGKKGVFKAGNSKVKYKHGETGAAANHWCRSVYVGYSNGFCLVHTSGSASGGNAYYSWGAAPGFAV